MNSQKLIHNSNHYLQIKNTAKPGRKQIFDQSKTSCSSRDTVEMEQHEEAAETKEVIEIEENLDDILRNSWRSSIYFTPRIPRRSNLYECQGNTRRPNIYDSQGNSRRSSSNSLNDTNDNNLHEQLLLEADFYAKAFPRRSLPAYAADTLSGHVQR